MRRNVLGHGFVPIFATVLMLLATDAMAAFTLEVRPRSRKTPDMYNAHGDEVVYSFQTRARQHHLSIGLRILDDLGAPLPDLACDEVRFTLDGQMLPATATQVHRANLSEQPLAVLLVFKVGLTMESTSQSDPLGVALREAKDLIDQLPDGTVVGIIAARGGGPAELLPPMPRGDKTWEALGTIRRAAAQTEEEADVCEALRDAVDIATGMGHAVPSDRCCIVVFADGNAPDAGLEQMSCDEATILRAEEAGVPIFAVWSGHEPMSERQARGLESLCGRTGGRFVPPDDYGDLLGAMMESVQRDWIVAVTIPESQLPTDGQDHVLGLTITREGHRIGGAKLPFFTSLTGWTWVLQRFLMYVVPVLFVVFAGILMLAMMRRQRLLRAA